MLLPSCHASTAVMLSYCCNALIAVTILLPSCSDRCHAHAYHTPSAVRSNCCPAPATVMHLLLSCADYCHAPTCVMIMHSAAMLLLLSCSYSSNAPTSVMLLLLSCSYSTYDILSVAMLLLPSCSNCCHASISVLSLLLLLWSCIRLPCCNAYAEVNFNDCNAFSALCLYTLLSCCFHDT